MVCATRDHYARFGSSASAMRIIEHFHHEAGVLSLYPVAAHKV
jgi:hypothetical protein